MTSERMASSLARPPALRMTWASPSARPANLAGSRRAALQVGVAKPGGRGGAASPPGPTDPGEGRVAAGAPPRMGHGRCGVEQGARHPRRSERVRVVRASTGDLVAREHRIVCCPIFGSYHHRVQHLRLTHTDRDLWIDIRLREFDGRPLAV